MFVSVVWAWHRPSREDVAAASGQHLLDVHFLYGGTLYCTLCVASVYKTHSIFLRDSSPIRGIARAERDGTRAETRFRLSSKRTSPFKSVGASVQSTAGSRGVRISLSNAGYTTFGDGVGVLTTHSIRQFPLHFPSRASQCATRFRISSTRYFLRLVIQIQPRILFS